VACTPVAGLVSEPSAGLSLAGRTVLVTGVSGALGAGTALTLAREGADVVGTYRSRPERAAQVMAALTPGRGTVLRADLDSPDGARQLWREARASAPVDTVVVNAAANAVTPLDGDDEAWDEGWTRLLQVNTLGAATLMRAAASDLAGSGGGSIIAISSWAALQGSRLADRGAYAASKAAMRNFAQTLARAHARSGVRVYVIAPGVVDAGMGTEGMDREQVLSVAEGLAMGRHVHVPEIAELVAFLATDRCPSLTGATLELNGASYLH
jgi:3-oxoacyl-[acyl-carrier protein] reductase